MEEVFSYPATLERAKAMARAKAAGQEIPNSSSSEREAATFKF